MTEIRKFQLESTFRIDAEYYGREIIEIESRLLKMGARPISDSVSISDGNHLGLSEEFQCKGIPYYRGGDVHGFFIENSLPEWYVDKDVFDRPQMARSHLRKGDVLLTIVGTIGNVAIVSTDAPALCNCKIAILRPKHESDTAVIASFLSCKYGKSQVDRLVRGSVQAGLNLDDFNKLLLPKISTDLTQRLVHAVNEARDKDFSSKSYLHDAEDELEHALGIDAWRPTEDNISVKTFADAMNAGRIDAEYFQLRHDEILARLKSLGKFEYASEILVAGLEKIVPESMERYIELADVGAQGTIEECTDAEWRDLPSRARQRIRSGQIIVSSIEGSLESCALVEGEFDNALCSTGFHRFHSEQTNSETLLLIFKSWPLQSLLKRGCSGTILTGISSSELERIPVPILPRKVQDSLAKKVRKAFALRKESKKLIAEAKQMVEDAIDGKVA